MKSVSATTRASVHASGDGDTTMKHRMVALAAALVALVITGCAAPGFGGDSYSREHARREQTVRIGVVESVREVKLEATRSGVGAGAAAITGGVAGSDIGHGTGPAIAAVAGALVGGGAGQAAEQGLTGERGAEVTVKLDTGQM